MEFSTGFLQRVLASHPTPTGYLVAYSGGLDSSVLLHAMARLRDSLGCPLMVAHVDHGLHPESANWASHCMAHCAALDLPFEPIRLETVPARGRSVEAQARDARYQVLAARLGSGGCLVTAHHLDDQAETLLLQLLRGAGPAGLAAMPARRPLGAGSLLRPLLGCSRDALRRWAEREGIDWLEDPSNSDTGFDRNYLRHRVLPLLQRRWPGYATAFRRSAAHLGDAAAIVAAQAAKDLAAARGAAGNRLSIGALSRLDRPRQRNLMRAWIADNHRPAPDTRTIDRLLDELVAARDDAMPLVTWHGAGSDGASAQATAARRFRDEIWLTEPLPELREDAVIAWPGVGDIELPAGLGHLSLEVDSGVTGLPAAWWREGRVRVRFRQQGLRCRIFRRAGRRPLKKVFQEFGVPPWLRDRVPLVFVDDQLAAVADYCRCEVDVAGGGTAGQHYRVRWCPPAGLR